ncbi:response regulator transcription factor [Paenibacillus fonticola]|uniref:response regulator transcription factor n=1 Tax=Paenibacillus fonticola TaxID=379896 RepID=UPI00037D0962|nr:response regulator transcription factor [Paenibacillus fonticola]
MWNVLLVDDEPLVLEGLRTMIAWEKYGFQICGEALNGSEAFRIIRDCQPELVFTDIHMPVLSGLDLIEQCNQLLPKPPKFVVLSGYDDFSYARTAMRQKVAEYLLKPIDDEDINNLLIKLNTNISDEIAAEQSEVKQQGLVVNHVVNRLIQGESNPILEHQAVKSLHLRDNAQLQCLLIEAPDMAVDLKAWTAAHFAQEAVHTFRDNAGRTGLLIQLEASLDDMAEEAAMELYKQLPARAEQPVLIAVSSQMGGIRSISKLYRQAAEIISAKQGQGRSGVFYYCGYPAAGTREVQHREKFDVLFNRVAEGNAENIRASVQEFFASFASHPYRIETARAYVVNLELMICQRIAEMNGEPDTLMKKLQQAYGSLGDIADYVTMKNYVLHLSVQAAVCLRQLRQENEGNTIFHVIQYVDREFRGKLQLKELARQFHMNATYLGQLFKKNTGKSFNTYLNDRRIEEAKRLLKRTQTKISDIAVQVGYPNTDYFIHKFKQSTGVLPSAYKQDAGINPANEPGGVTDG